MRPIPHQREGYSVDVGAGVVHRRYPAHGDVRPRVRNLRGVRAYLQGGDGRPCERCWPEPPVEPRTPRSRRPAIDDVKAVVVRAAGEVLGPEAAAIVEAGFDAGFDDAAATRGRGRVRIEHFDVAGESTTALEALQTLTVEPEPAVETAAREDAGKDASAPDGEEGGGRAAAEPSADEAPAP